MFWIFLGIIKLSSSGFLNILLKKVPTGPADADIGNSKTIKTKKSFLGLMKYLKLLFDPILLER